ncbi:tyrosine-type recombinase/integrase [Methylocella sp.]|uniref:tyrosine-type recombinase/integrase n=1 Tax=Methylocella sp. TaxID=1978226 RepID=UPI0035B36996
MKKRGAHLQLHNGVWRVALRVPKAAQATFGGKTILRKGLGTKDFDEAEVRKLAVLADWKRAFANAVLGKPLRPPQEAAGETSTWPMTLSPQERVAAVYEALKGAVIEIEGASEEEPWAAVEDYREAVFEQAQRAGMDERQLQQAWGAVAGNRTLTEAALARWEREAVVSDGVKAMWRREVKRLSDWHADGLAFETMSRRRAGEYIDHLITGGANKVTIGNRQRALSAFWNWSIKRGLTEINVWSGQAPSVKRERDTSGKRPLTHEETVALMKAEGKPAAKDALLVALLSGLRRGEIAALKSEDVGGGWITVRKGKTASAARRVPVHPALKETIERRVGKAQAGVLFPEYAATRLDRLSKDVAALIDAALPDLQRQGRQAPVDLHSGRRWFAARIVEGLERPGCQYSSVTLDKLMGHRTVNLAVQTYGQQAGREEAMKAAVEGIAWPPVNRALLADADVEPAEP